MPSVINSLITERELREMNQELLISAVRQHELADEARQAMESLCRTEVRLAAELSATQALQELSAKMIAEGDPQPLYEQILDVAATIMQSDFASMQVVDNRRGTPGTALRLLAFRGFNPQAAQFWEWVQPAATCSCGQALSTGQRCLVEDIEKCPWMAGTDNLMAYRDTGIRSVQSTPLIARSGRVLGMISTHWRRPHAPAESELRRLDILARQAADLLERRQTEEALRQSEERYRSLTQAITSVVWTTNAEGRFVAPQPSWSRFTGQTWEEARDFGWVNALHPDDRVRVRELWELACVSGSVYNSDGRLWYAPSGVYRRFEVHGMPILNADGSVREWIGQCTDVEDRKQAQQAAERLAAIVKFSEDAIISKDLEGVITSWNQGAKSIFGYEEAEAIGKPVTLLIPPDRLDEETRILDRIRRGEPVEHFETVRRRKDGSFLDISLTVSPMKDAAGRVIGASKVARDITERKQLEQRAERHAVALADLHRRKDEFLAMLSHELRNPLAPLSNAVQLLRLQVNEDPLQQQARAIIERQLGQLTRLVEDLLEVSRISTGRIHLHQERVALNGIVENAIETCCPLIGRHRHNLQASLSPEPVWIYADAARIEQVVVNLLTNAAKYTEDGGQIELSVEQAGEEAVLRVRDSGVGIAPELLPRIFDLFTQAERSLDRAQGGLGIGLSLVQKLVEMHRGRVEVQSTLGQGSEFIIRLPVLGTQPSLPAGDIAPAARPQGPSVRVLVVDDNVDAAQTLGMLLRIKGHDVRIAHDGLAALEAAAEFEPAVVLLDIGLPGLDGYEVAKQVRARADLHSAVLIAMTGYGQDSDRQRSLAAGFDHHLVKPVQFEKVQEILAGALHKSV